MTMNPYLSFKGDCEAAFKYYEQHLGGEVGDLFRRRYAALRQRPRRLAGQDHARQHHDRRPDVAGG